MYYRVDRITGQLFRKGKDLPEEYISTKDRWEVTPSAIEAFYEGIDTYLIPEEEAVVIMARMKGNNVWN